MSESCDGYCHPTQEAHKFTLGQHKFKYVPYAVITVLEEKGVGAASYLLAECLSITVLLEWDNVTLKTSVVNPASFCHIY